MARGWVLALLSGAAMCRAAEADTGASPAPLAVALPPAEVASAEVVEPPAPPAPAAASAPQVDAVRRPTLVINGPGANDEGWCVDGVDALDPETCIVVPEEIEPPRTVVIYLHGVINPWNQNHNRDYQLIVRDNARHRGFVAILPRGRRGIGPGGARDHWAWPTTTDVYKQLAKEIGAHLLEKKKFVEDGLGQPFEKTFLAGSSNGAYFLTTLALHGDIVVDGFAALCGGTKGGWSRWTLGNNQPRPPFYVGYGSSDDSKGDPMSLGDLLRDVRWPHKVVEHHFGHGAQPVYLEEAVPYLGGP